MLCATVAFGVGMDVPAINLVIHWDAADTLLDFVQQTGRAGRDGSACTCITFYSKEHVNKHVRMARKATDEHKRDYMYACMKKVCATTTVTGCLFLTHCASVRYPVV